MSTALLDVSAAAQLRGAAEAAAAGREYGAVDIILPDRVWRQLRDELALVRPWPADAEVEALILLSPTGALRCWPPGADISGARIGWGETGNPDGPTREG